MSILRAGFTDVRASVTNCRKTFSVTVVLGSVDAELIEYLWPALAVA